MTDNRARLLVAGLLFSTSGLACLLLCATVCAENAPKARACCHESAEERAASGGVDGVAIDRTRDAAGCCMLRARNTLAAPVPSGFDAPASPPPSSATLVVAPAAPLPTAPVVSGPVHNRGDTHLRCCVFLI
jgi:hypothetical protein